MLEVKFITTFTAADLCNIFTTAFEGGSNYWIDSVEPLSDVPPGDVVWWGRYQFWDNPNLMFSITDDEGNTHVIRLKEIQAGLDHAAEAYPSHFSDFVSGDWDAETMDVFVQCITFKDIIYG